MNKAQATRWLIFALIAVVLIIFIQVPISLPSFHTKIVEALYDTIEHLPKGSFVLLSFYYSPGSDAELTPMARVLLYHIFKRGLHPLAVCYLAPGATLMVDTIRQVASGMNKKENLDYVILGTIPAGMVNNIITMGENFHQAFPIADKIPLLSKVHNFKDISLVIDITPSGTLDGVWIPYGVEKFGIHLAGGVTGVMATDYYPYFQSGQIQGLLGGLSGAFQYESLLGKDYERFHRTAFGTPPLGQKRMVPQTFVHAAILLLIVVGNILYFVGKRKRT